MNGFGIDVGFRMNLIVNQVLELYGELSGFRLRLHLTWNYQLPVDEDVKVLVPCHDKKDEVEVKIWMKE